MIEQAVAASPVFCPRCAHNLTAEQPTTIGPLSFDPLGVAAWNGAELPLTPSQFQLVGSLVAARGKVVSYEALAERAGYDGSGDANDVVQVLFCRARGVLRQLGAPSTIIKSVPRRGYCLDVALLDELADEGPRKC